MFNVSRQFLDNMFVSLQRTFDDQYIRVVPPNSNEDIHNRCDRDMTSRKVIIITTSQDFVYESKESKYYLDESETHSYHYINVEDNKIGNDDKTTTILIHVSTESLSKR